MLSAMFMFISVVARCRIARKVAESSWAVDWGSVLGPKDEAAERLPLPHDMTGRAEVDISTGHGRYFEASRETRGLGTH